MGDSDRPIVWAFRQGYFGPPGDADEAWMAITDDGRVIAQHISSNRDWGQHDVSPRRAPKWPAYVKALGVTDPDQVDYRVLPDGDIPPPHVVEAARARAEEQERFDG